MYFKEQKFLVAGMSKSGTACCEFLLARGAVVYMYDDVAAGAVQSAMARLEERGAVPLRGGGFESAAEECDVLVLSPPRYPRTVSRLIWCWWRLGRAWRPAALNTPA